MTGFEPLIAAATAGLTGIITDIIKEKGGKLLKQADVDVLPKLKQAVRQYIETYEQRHGKLKVVCVRLDDPVKLDDIYTTVQLLNRSETYYFESPENLEKLFRESGRGFKFEKATRQDGIAVANQQQFLLVLGGPGVGKSTFLRKVGLEALKAQRLGSAAQAGMNTALRQLPGQKSSSPTLTDSGFQHLCIPVFLRLQDFNSSQVTIQQLIVNEFEICGFPEAATLTQTLLEKGKLLVLLDGLDEVPTECVDTAIQQIRDLVDRYKENRFIASCRIAAYKGGFGQFKDVAMAAFDDAQIEQFICNWFRAEPETANQCWELLQQPEYAAAKELAQTPLLLTLLCGVYDESQTFPKKRAGVYGEALDVLLKKWAAEKRIKRDPIYRDFHPELEQRLLTEVAHHYFVADQLFFSKREIVSQIRGFLVNTLNAPNHLDGEAVLEAIAVQQGIFVERARETYSFSHLTLQEYLVAQFIVDEGLVESFAATHLTDQRWREVFLLVAGLANRADVLLQAMERSAQSLLKSPPLQALLVWADKNTAGSEGNFKPAAKRIAAVAIALDRNRNRNRSLALDLDLDRTLARILALALASTLALALDLDRNRDRDRDRALDLAIDRSRDRALDLTLDLARDLDLAHDFEKIKIFQSINLSALITQLETLHTQIPSEYESLAERRSFVEQLHHTWCRALHLQPEWLAWSEEEIEALNQYFYTCELMVRCKEAAVRVSPQVWQGIEERMLTVPK